MTKFAEKPTIITLKIQQKTDQNEMLAGWQAKMNSTVVAQPGFVSLEFLSPKEKEWVVVQRFASKVLAEDWKQSPTYLNLKNELQAGGTQEIEEITSSESTLNNGVTEVILTEVIPEQEESYRKWSAKIHLCEAKFPGFRGVYVQSPKEVQGKYWITLLQFDTMENLDRWLNSSERHDLLSESKLMISNLESHRVISPYAGWFASIIKKTGEVPPAWKQTMIVLLVLFPIVMLEIKYLNPLLANLNLSLGTFIGNALSAALISFPMVPIAIFFLKWWLLPDNKNRKMVSIVGTLLVLALYLMEIWIFWK